MSLGRRARITPLFLVLVCIGCSTIVQPQGPTTQGASQTTESPTGSSGQSSPPSASVSAEVGTPAVQANPGGLSDELMVGQLFMTYVYGSSATDATTSQRNANLALYGAATGTAVIRRWYLGGIILLDHNNLDPNRPQLSTGNVNNAAQITSLTAGLQRAALVDSGVALFIATDQEGGRVQRITDGVTRRPPKSKSPEKAKYSFVAVTSPWVESCVSLESTRTWPLSPTSCARPPESSATGASAPARPSTPETSSLP